MRVALVTGASGFIGRHAVSALAERGFEVHGIARAPGRQGECRWHVADLLDARAVRSVVREVRASHLLHLAWVTDHGRYWSAPENLRWAEATIGLWRHFHEAGGIRAVGAGTCAEYSWDEAVTSSGGLNERETPRNPRHLYGIAKNATFELLSGHAQVAGVGFAWGRLFFPYGPDRRPTLVPEIIRAVRAGRPALCTHGRQQRDFIHVIDAAGALAALLDSEVQGAVNIATGTGTAVAHVATRLGELLGRPDLIRLGALETRRDEPERLVADVGRLRTEVGYVPKIDLEEGLRRTVAAS